MKIFYSLFLLLILFTNIVLAQDDTLVYNRSASGELAKDGEQVAGKLVVFPVGSGASTRLSAIKGYDNNRRLIFSGFSSIHGFPVKIQGDFTEYYPDGKTMMVSKYVDGRKTGEETDYYPNGQIMLTLVKLTARSDLERKEYYEDGKLRYEHHPRGWGTGDETFYYPDGKIKLKQEQDEHGAGSVTEYYPNGKIKSVEKLGFTGGKNEKIAYYPNGNLYYKKERTLSGLRFRFTYIECRDSTGKLLTDNGNGYWVEFDNNFAFIAKQGNVVNGYADGAWTVRFSNNRGEHENYQEGKLTSSNSFETKDTVAAAGYKAPEYPGGYRLFYKFLTGNIRFPALAYENDIEGHLVVSFNICTDGSVSDVNILTGIGGGCDEEIVRVIKTSPLWIPATKNGAPVNSSFAVQADFSLDKRLHEGRIHVGG